MPQGHMHMPQGLMLRGAARAVSQPQRPWCVCVCGGVVVGGGSRPCTPRCPCNTVAILWRVGIRPCNILTPPPPTKALLTPQPNQTLRPDTSVQPPMQA
eukprot:363338-Chlamydomonas_euryale.AAC.4